MFSLEPEAKSLDKAFISKTITVSKSLYSIKYKNLKNGLKINSLET